MIYLCFIASVIGMVAQSYIGDQGYAVVATAVCVLLLTKIMTFKEICSNLGAPIILMSAGVIGVAEALGVTGLTNLVGETVAGMLGSNISPFILIFVLLLGFALGISYLLACAYVSFGDVRHLYTVVLTLWMYCSAIFYPITQLQGIARTLVAFNPLYSYIEAFRIIVLEQALPPSPLLARMLFWCLLSLGAGRICYARLHGSLMQRL